MSSIHIPRLEYQTFLGSFGNFTDFITILLEKRNPTFNVYWRLEFAKSTAHWFYDRLNKKVYGRSYRAGHKQLGIVIAHEYGDLTERPHFHIVLERPTHFKQSQFHSLIESIFNKMEWAHGSIHFKPYIDSGCIRYMCKGDFEKIIYFERTKG